MQSLIALLLQLSGKAWATLVVMVLCGGALTAVYLLPPRAGGPAPAGGPAHPPVALAALPAGGPLGAAHCAAPAPVPVVPEANAGLVLIPVLGAVLVVATRRLWLARPAVATGAPRRAGGAEPPQTA